MPCFRTMPQLVAPLLAADRRLSRCFVVVLALVVAALTAGPVGAAGETDGDLDASAAIRYERVALFKNGLGFFQGIAATPRGATSVRLDRVPVPVHGTFWVASPPQLDVRGIFTRMQETPGERPVVSGLELLRANAGRQVTLRKRDGEIVRGRVRPMPEMDDRRDLAAADRGPYPTRPPARVASSPASDLLLVETEDGLVALSANSLDEIRFDTGQPATTLPYSERRPAIHLELASPSRGQDVSLSFLASGITWAPSYRIDLSDPDTAVFSAKAVVVNEVADLENVRLELVSGFPNLAFSGVRSPLAMSEDLRQFLSSLAHRGQSMGGAMGQQMALSNRAQYAPMPTPELDYAAPEEATAAEDLFFYPVDEIDLDRGETVLLPLFTVEMPYEHIYTWTVDDKLDERGAYRREEKDDEAEEVWHSCRLTNTLDMPLTTAPAEFVTDGRLTGQDIAHYTAPGAETTIRINRALGVVAQERELERSRERDVKKFQGYRHDLVEIEGALSLANHTRKTVRVEVTKVLTGDVRQSTPEARVEAITRGLQAVNSRHELVWEVELEPGEDVRLTYVYGVYLRS